MKQTIELNQEDIKQLIAKEFDVKEEQVSVSISKVYSGYGNGCDILFNMTHIWYA